VRGNRQNYRMRNSKVCTFNSGFISRSIIRTEHEHGLKKSEMLEQFSAQNPRKDANNSKIQNKDNIKQKLSP
jgi:hypothetical protein